MSPMKDFLIALAFTYMYYAKGVLNVQKPLDEKAKEKLLFKTENQGEECQSN